MFIIDLGKGEQCVDFLCTRQAETIIGDERNTDSFRVTYMPSLYFFLVAMSIICLGLAFLVLVLVLRSWSCVIGLAFLILVLRSWSWFCVLGLDLALDLGHGLAIALDLVLILKMGVIVLMMQSQSKTHYAKLTPRPA